jgi:hypothetical protein
MISSPEKLIQLLDELPENIRTQEAICKEKEHQVALAKLELSVAQSTSFFASTGSAVERKARSVADTVAEQRKVLEAERELGEQSVQLEYLSNRFISLRKITSLETELIKTQLT